MMRWLPLCSLMVPVVAVAAGLQPGEYHDHVHVVISGAPTPIAPRDLDRNVCVTAADVAVTYALHLAQHLELAAQFPPAVADYWQRMQARPAFQRALQAQHQAALDQAVDPTPSPDLRPA